VILLKFGQIKPTKQPKFGQLSPINDWGFGFDNKTEFELARIAIVNEFDLISPTKDKIIAEIEKRQKAGLSLHLGVRKMAHNQILDTFIGKIPTRNLLLKCSNTTKLKDSATHLLLNYGFVSEAKPKQPFLHAINSRCKECGGILMPNAEFLKTI